MEPFRPSQLIQLLKLMENKDVTRERLSELLSSGFLADLLDRNAKVGRSTRDEFRIALGLTPIEMRVRIDYRQSLRELIDAGNYHIIAGLEDTYIPPDPNGGRMKPVMLKFKLVDPEKVVAEMLPELHARAGNRAATFKELLAFGAQHPKIQTKHVIVATGTETKAPNQRPGFPYLDHANGKRIMMATQFGKFWKHGTLHLVVALN